jgi:hypothetical protein
VSSCDVAQHRGGRDSAPVAAPKAEAVVKPEAGGLQAMQVDGSTKPKAAPPVPAPTPAASAVKPAAPAPMDVDERPKVSEPRALSHSPNTYCGRENYSVSVCKCFSVVGVP